MQIRAFLSLHYTPLEFSVQKKNCENNINISVYNSMQMSSHKKPKIGSEIDLEVNKLKSGS